MCAPGLRAPPRFLICCVSKKEEIYDLETNGDADLTTDTTNDTATAFDTDTNSDSDFDLGGAVWLGPAQSILLRHQIKRENINVIYHNFHLVDIV